MSNIYPNLRKNLSLFLYKNRPAQIALLNVIKLSKFGIRLAPWGLPLAIGAGWFVAPAIPDSVWKSVGLGSSPAPSSARFKRGDEEDEMPSEK